MTGVKILNILSSVSFSPCSYNHDARSRTIPQEAVSKKRSSRRQPSACPARYIEQRD
jgi:hypothetical protein